MLPAVRQRRNSVTVRCNLLKFFAFLNDRPGVPRRPLCGNVPPKSVVLRQNFHGGDPSFFAPNEGITAPRIASETTPWVTDIITARNAELLARAASNTGEQTDLLGDWCCVKEMRRLRLFVV